MAGSFGAWRGIGSVLGGVCLGATLLLTPLGVQIVRAGEEIDAKPVGESLAHAIEAQTPGAAVEETAPAAIAPAEGGAPAEQGERIELDATDAPRVVPLNTQGYNYLPDGAPVR